MQVLADLGKKKKENQKSVLWLTSYWHTFASQRNNFIILGLENSLTIGSKDTERGGDVGNLTHPSLAHKDALSKKATCPTSSLFQL